MEPIAVVGLALRFSGDAITEKDFWKVMMEKRCTMTEWPKSRINIDAFHSKDNASTNLISARGANLLSEDPMLFDAPFFSISTTEAAALDPQQCLLLETAYQALENGGLTLDSIRGSNTGVYTGCMNDDHKTLLARDIDLTPKYSAIGVSPSMLANRISWMFDLKGPSMNLDSACSSSLMALDIACQALRSGDTCMALVGGVNVILGVESSIGMSKMGIISPDGISHSFDERANGFARGEGIGVVVLKRLSDAVRDNDTIRAVVRSTASNQDGRTPGITQPSKDSQEKLIRHTYAKAGLDRSHTRYFEAHGTGTPIGDPIEASAIASVFSDCRTKADPLYIGAMKANFGHMEGASGIAAFIKTVMVLESGIIPPIAQLETLNPRIPAKFWNVEFVREAKALPGDVVKRASVNSFGFGGSNTHVVIDGAGEYLTSNNITAHYSSSSRTLNEINGHHREKDVPYVLTWSANDESSLKRVTERFAEHLKDGVDDKYLQQLAYTLSCRRNVHAWRSSSVLNSIEDVRKLATLVSPPARAGRERRAIFVFTGQGAQYKNMGIQLLDWSGFKNSLEKFDDSLRHLGCTWSLFEVLHSDDNRIHEPHYSQPLCTALQVALVDLYRNFGVLPSAVIGHSSGEVAAAYAAGAIDLVSACKISYYRGLYAARISRSGHGGSMLAVGLSETDILAHLDSSPLSLACINSPTNVTVAGPEDHIKSLHARLQTENIFSAVLKTGVAYHSSIMTSVAEDYGEAIKDLARPADVRATIPIVSTITAELVIDLNCFTDAQYWVRNLVSPVKFSQALSRLTSKQRSTRKLGQKAQIDLHDIIEIGPGSALKRPIQETLKHDKRQLQYHQSLSRHESASTCVLRLTGQLFCLGYRIDFASVNRLDPHKRYRTLTDLPSYSFSNTRSYWQESTLSAQTRRRHHFPRPLLGAPVADWNPLEPKWRQYLSVQALPWLADHKVDGAILLPGAAMIILALEAAHQMAPPDAKIIGYWIKEATFSIPIVIPAEEEQHAEIETNYRTKWSPLANGSAWSEVRICLRSGESIQEACRAVLQVELDQPRTGLDDGAEKEMHASLLKDRYITLAAPCDKAIDAKAVYRTYHKMGLEYGPSFQGLVQPSWNQNDTCKAGIILPQENVSNSIDSQNFLIHPATLDILAHLMWVPLTHGGTRVVPTALPTRIRDAWISNVGLRDNRKRPMHGVARAFKRDFRVVEGTAIMLNDLDEPILTLGTLEFTTITRPGPDSAESNFQPLFFSLRDKPDIDLIEKSYLPRFIEPVQTHSETEASFNHDVHEALQWFIGSALQEFDEVMLSVLSPHMRLYIDWMRLQCKTNPTINSATTSNVAEREDLLHRIEDTNERGKVYVAFGRQLLSIICGKVDPLEVLFTSGLAEGFYTDLVRSVSAGAKLWNYLDALAFKNPALKILEVGAGTGSMTPFVLAPLLAESNANEVYPKFSEYDFTDVSAAFFEKAKAKLADSMPIGNINFKVFDLEADPETQGLECASYDLIVAASVIHATKDLKHTLMRLRKLLKPGGKLILFEVIQPECIRAAFVFGTLPGWWMSTDSRDGYRTLGPNISGEQWAEVLSATGFSVDATIRDHDDDLCHEFGFIFASAVDQGTLAVDPDRRTTIVVSPNCETQLELALSIQRAIGNQGYPTCKMLTLDDLITPQSLAGQRIIVLAEMVSPLLRHITEPQFDAINLIAACGKGVLWVTRTGRDTEQYADFQMIDGLARVLRTENPNRAFVTLALQDNNNIEANANAITKVLHELENGHWSTEHCEMEYFEHNDMLHIRRLLEEDALDNQIQAKVTPQLRQETWEFASPLALTVHSPGLLDSLCFMADIGGGAELPLGLGEVEIDVRAVGVNFRDVLIALGALDSDRLGVECTGIVRRAGTKSAIQPGERVIVAKMGCASSLVRCSSEVVVKIPEGMSFEYAASFPTAGVTAYYSLIEMARLQAGETILIHAGAGGTGQMCIQLAQKVGAEVYVTTSSETKKAFLMTTYGISSDHIFYSRNTSFAQSMRQATGGRGVDVLVNSLAGDSLIASWELMAPHGRFVELGRADIRGNSNLPMMSFENNVSFIGVAIDYICDHRPALLGKMLRAVTDMIANGVLRLPFPIRSYSVSEVVDAFRYLQSGASIGKIVLTMDPSDVVQTYRFQQSHWAFPEDATYVIAGGLGGLGRSAARWMVLKGAKNLILLSRSGAVTKAAQELLQDLRKAGAMVEAPSCDVTSDESLVSVLQHAAETMPPIKGCLQGTMVLRDALFEKMSYADWITAARSKTDASWNLHKHLPSGMDFFVLLSSLCGIVGNLGQANYAAGNTYQDALAHYRISQGEKATSLDIGAMASVGIIAENTDFMGLMGHDEDVIRVVQEEEFHATLDIYLGPDAPQTDSEIGAQALVGMSTPQIYIDKGIELPSLLSQRLYASIARLGSHSSDGRLSNTQDSDGVNYFKAFRSATSADEASAVVLSALTSKLSRALSVAPEDLDPSKPLHQYGVDSLVAVELRNWFGKEFEASVTVLKIMNAVDVRAVAALIVIESTAKMQFAP